MKRNCSGALSLHFSLQNRFKTKGNRTGALSLHFSFQNWLNMYGNRSGALSLHFSFQIEFKMKRSGTGVASLHFSFWNRFKMKGMSCWSASHSFFTRANSTVLLQGNPPKTYAKPKFLEQKSRQYNTFARQPSQNLSKTKVVLEHKSQQYSTFARHPSQNLSKTKAFGAKDPTVQHFCKATLPKPKQNQSFWSKRADSTRLLQGNPS